VARVGTAPGETLAVAETAVAGVVGDEADLGEGGDVGLGLTCPPGVRVESTTGRDELLADTEGGRWGSASATLKPARTSSAQNISRPLPAT